MTDHDVVQSCFICSQTIGHGMGHGYNSTFHVFPKVPQLVFGHVCKLWEISTWKYGTCLTSPFEHQLLAPRWAATGPLCLKDRFLPRAAMG